jgi:hypothetical protein
MTGAIAYVPYRLCRQRSHHASRGQFGDLYDRAWNRDGELLAAVATDHITDGPAVSLEDLGHLPQALITGLMSVVVVEPLEYGRRLARLLRRGVGPVTRFYAPFPALAAPIPR